MHLGGNRRLGAPNERSAINDNLREYISLILLRYAKNESSAVNVHDMSFSTERENKNP